MSRRSHLTTLLGFGGESRAAEHALAFLFLRLLGENLRVTNRASSSWDGLATVPDDCLGSVLDDACRGCEKTWPPLTGFFDGVAFSRCPSSSLRDSIEKVERVVASYPAATCLADAYQTTRSLTTAQWQGAFFTPYPLARVLAQVQEPSPNEWVLDPACGGGVMLVAALDVARELHGATAALALTLIGVELDPRTALIAREPRARRRPSRPVLDRHRQRARPAPRRIRSSERAPPAPAVHAVDRESALRQSGFAGRSLRGWPAARRARPRSLPPSPSPERGALVMPTQRRRAVSAPVRERAQLKGVLSAPSTTSRHAHDLLTTGMTFSVRSDLLPCWTPVEAPTPAIPYWRDEADGQRRHVHELLVGALDADRDHLEREHAAAIASIAAAAMDAWRDERRAEARRLAHAAARLSEEIVGFWPTSSHAVERC